MPADSTTYAALGALGGFLGATLGRLPWLAPLGGVLLLIGAALFLGQALKRLGLGAWFIALLPTTGPTAWQRAIGRMAHRIDRSRPRGGFVLGILLGFLPCGFLWAALAVAAATGNPFVGAAAMFAFGLGTVPALVGIGVAGQVAGRASGGLLRVIGPAVLILDALVLAVLALTRFAA